jgi:hypothetical protein
MVGSFGVRGITRMIGARAAGGIRANRDQPSVLLRSPGRGRYSLRGRQYPDLNVAAPADRGGGTGADPQLHELQGKLKDEITAS